MRLFFFRHGLSHANELQLVTGTPSDELSKVGISQANRLANWVHQLGITADFYTFSHWLRAQQTAKIVFPNVKWYEDDKLGETCAGSVANSTLTSFLQQHPNFYCDPNSCYPGGESHYDLKQRVDTWLNDLLRQSHKSAVIMSHAGPIACVLHQLLDIPLSQFPTIMPGNATLTIIDAELKQGKVTGKVIGLSLGSIENLNDSLKG
ncbi:histidine phosphatase family protein [Rahnella aceris]|uniref:histidine phosphatase family protein n=1 Tax=Rahnella sp. (strain Y9602) TaxID=2703885 RepID=UPI001906D1CA|nr:histidine phosphatase family protein [Rahnella aceris]QQN35638.1 histidine phosphatase family protein [Rahnella aceris]